MKSALILMTAMPPTTGHADLIRFAANLPDTFVRVLVSGRSFEPLVPEERADALAEHFENYPNVEITYSLEDDAPQNPEDHPDFWNWWKNHINMCFDEGMGPILWDYVVASEPYGLQVAEVLGAEFMPYDLGRTINPVRGTNVRNHLLQHWDEIIPEYRRKIMVKATLFGQESVGKSTITKALGDSFPTDTRFEWARPYLESVGPETTYERLNNIFYGQYALQKTAFESAKLPWVVFDTDLFSTIGYYRIMGWEIPEGFVQMAMQYKSDIYYVLEDNIPFESDILRYVAGKRQSSMQFWVDLLEEFGLDYKVVNKKTVEGRLRSVRDDLLFRMPRLQFDRELPKELV